MFEHLLALLVEGLDGTAIVLLDPEGKIVRCNAGARRLFDYQPEAILHMEFARLFAECEPDGSDPHGLLEAASRSGREAREARLIRQDGSCWWGSLDLYALHEVGGPLLGYGAVFGDPSREKIDADGLAAFHALGPLLNRVTSPEEAARVVLEIADRLVGWDACWLELCDGDERSARTVVLQDLIDGRRCDVPAPRSRRETCALARRSFREGPLLLQRDALDPDDGWSDGYDSFGDTARVSNSLMVVPIRSAQRTVGAMSIQSYGFQAYSRADLELLEALAEYCAGALERTLAEAARQDLERQLQQSRQLEAVGRLAGGVAHDFNNMLSVINGYAGLLLKALPPDSPAREGLGEISAAGARAAELTRQLLAFSRRQLLSPRPLDLNVLVAELRPAIAGALGESVELEIQLASGEVRIEADPAQLEQVLLTLAAHARDAVAGTGTVSIIVRSLEVSKAHARRHPGVSPGPYACLEITDSGQGLSAEGLERIWEPFFSTREIGRGRGLGLAAVYGMVKQSDGHIEVDSRPGDGTTFRLYFPLS